MEYIDPDQNVVRSANAAPASPSTAVRGDDSATQVGNANRMLTGVTSGVTPDRLGGEAAEVRRRISALADAATRAPVIRSEIARAFAAFISTAPSVEELLDAERAVTDCTTRSSIASAQAHTPGASKADQDAADAAFHAAANAKTHLADLQQKRKDAREKLFDALRIAAAKVQAI